MGNVRLFVYGTLKEGFENHARYCSNAGRIEKATASGRLYDTGAGYPAMQFSDNPAEIVHGEIITLPEADLPLLDELEEVPELYCRQEISCQLTSGKPVIAWCYIMERLPEHALLIDSGRWE